MKCQAILRPDKLAKILSIPTETSTESSYLKDFSHRGAMGVEAERQELLAGRRPGDIPQDHARGDNTMAAFADRHRETRGT